ncbi:unnamed protein product [Vicia faba]|uniref:Uncharacterized protein n=1 Tax=Vicia faba TaxID=3906 RepID=A0AAV1AZX2_VICFA|nr:unnamed protein product [Vicia faba]
MIRDVVGDDGLLWHRQGFGRMIIYARPGECWKFGLKIGLSISLGHLDRLSIILENDRISGQSTTRKDYRVGHKDNPRPEKEHQEGKYQDNLHQRQDDKMVGYQDNPRPMEGHQEGRYQDNPHPRQDDKMVGYQDNPRPMEGHKEGRYQDNPQPKTRHRKGVESKDDTRSRKKVNSWKYNSVVC